MFQDCIAVKNALSINRTNEEIWYFLCSLLSVPRSVTRSKPGRLAGSRRWIGTRLPRVRNRVANRSSHGSRTMKKGRHNHLHAKFTRLRRHLEISVDKLRPRRIRTRSARYAAALGEQLGLITRPKCCSWCRRRRRLERHHWDYDEPLNVTYLCVECHDIADSMVMAAGIA